VFHRAYSRENGFSRLDAKRESQEMPLLLRLYGASKTKRYASGNGLFLFSAFSFVTKKTSNTGMEKLPDRTHTTMYGVSPLHRLLEGSSMKSYGEEKTHRYSTNNT